MQKEMNKWLEEHQEYNLGWMKEDIALCGTEEEQTEAIINMVKADMREAL